ncbi:MAG: polysaccharide deacetylase family protein [Terriglobales bacterium]
MSLVIYRKFRRVLSLLISLMVYFADSFRRAILFLCGKRRRSTCTVLYYHAIRNDDRAGFARQMDTLRRLTEPIAIDGPAALLPNKQYSAVTFDDGFESTIRNAVPELEKRRIPAAIFAIPDLLGGFASWWPQTSPERYETLASADRLRALPKDLIAIGSHTLSHPRLPELGEARARQELAESRTKLEQLLSRRVNTFSFPYGSFNEQLIEWCRDAGYERVFTTLPFPAFATPHEFVVGRVTVEPTDWPLEFRLKVLGAYRWLPLAFRLKRKLFPARTAGNGRNLAASMARK